MQLLLYILDSCFRRNDEHEVQNKIYFSREGAKVAKKSKAGLKKTKSDFTRRHKGTKKISNKIKIYFSRKGAEVAKKS